MGFEERLPLAFHCYADGLAVVAATDRYREIAGLRVVQIGSLRPEEFVAAVTPFIAQENDIWVRLQSINLLRLQPVLAHLHLLDAGGLLPLTLDGPSTRPLVVRVAHSSQQEQQLSFRQVRGTPVLYTSAPGKLYWWKLLPESRTLYIQYNACVPESNLPMSEFARSVTAELDSRRVEGVVLDLRRTGGGDSRVINPLKSVLTQHARRTKSRIFVLIGPGTMSSAMDNAVAMKMQGSVLVGERTGKPNGSGAVKTLTLPNSGLSVRYTSKSFSVPKALDASALEPMTLRDALAGHDAGLAAAIAAR